LNETTKKYVHALNCTLTATERTMCCILENYQTEEGLVVPEVLRNYMGGKSFIPFKDLKKKADKVADEIDKISLNVA
jgi:seryl-tRNA synthetase